VENTVVRCRCDLRLPVEPVDPGEVVTDTTAINIEIDCDARPSGIEMPDGRLTTRTRERHTAVQQLVSNLDDDLGDQQEAEPRPQDRPPLRPRP
jgi:hypothetical protein